jgi:hypothetical protein
MHRLAPIKQRPTTATEQSLRCLDMLHQDERKSLTGLQDLQDQQDSDWVCILFILQIL